MAVRKQSKKQKEHTGFVSNGEQAVFIFRTLFTDYKEDRLTNGILLWLSKMDDSSLSLRIFLSLPELMEQENTVLMIFLTARLIYPKFRTGKSSELLA